MKADGLCECGCGQRTAVVDKTQASEGLRAGDHRRFCFNHSKRKLNNYEVDESTGCWVWKGKLDKHGYGVTRNPWPENGETSRLAHRVMYAHLVGAIPEGMQLDHLCKNTACCNPYHLEPVTGTENVRRGSATKLRAASVDQIRTELAEGNKLVDIARRHGVTPGTIWHIRENRNWRGEMD